MWCLFTELESITFFKLNPEKFWLLQMSLGRADEWNSIFQV